MAVDPNDPRFWQAWGYQMSPTPYGPPSPPEVEGWLNWVASEPGQPATQGDATAFQPQAEYDPNAVDRGYRNPYGQPYLTGSNYGQDPGFYYNTETNSTPLLEHPSPIWYSKPSYIAAHDPYLTPEPIEVIPTLGDTDRYNPVDDSYPPGYPTVQDSPFGVFSPLGSPPDDLPEEPPSRRQPLRPIERRRKKAGEQWDDAWEQY